MSGTIINGHDPLEDKDPGSINPNADTDFYIDEFGYIVHGCEGAIGISWTPPQAREAARRLLIMADEAERESA